MLMVIILHLLLFFPEAIMWQNNTEIMTQYHEITLTICSLIMTKLILLYPIVHSPNILERSPNTMHHLQQIMSSWSLCVPSIVSAILCMSLCSSSSKSNSTGLYFASFRLFHLSMLLSLLLTCMTVLHKTMYFVFIFLSGFSPKFSSALTVQIRH